MKNSLSDLKKIAATLRYRTVEHSARSKTPHLGSCLSCMDILTALYFYKMHIDPQTAKDPKRDRFVLSKGHAAPALFQVLALSGFFPYERLIQSSHDGTDIFGEHLPTPADLPGVEAATGSLGHGLPMAVGMAMAAKLTKTQNAVYVLVGDGECNEGSIWEAALFAATHKLKNLVVFVDYNKWQATGRSQEVMALEPLKEKWESFGWDSHEIDGHDMEAICRLLDNIPHNQEKPTAIIAHTLKGKGVSFMEDDNNWHYCIPSNDEVEKSRIELGLSDA